MSDRTDLLPVALGDRRYLLDWTGYRRQTVAAMREMVDQGGEAGDQSFTNLGIFRRSGEDFVLGAGQTWFDLLEESNRRRFRISKGVNPWNRRQLQLHHDTGLAQSSAAAVGFIVPAGTRLWMLAGTTVGYATDPEVATWSLTSITYAGATITAATANGKRMWFADGANVYYIDNDGASVSTFSTSDTDHLAYANGRLICSHGGELFELDAVGTKTTIWTHPTSDWVWDAIVGAPNGIYCAGHSGDKAEVYMITVIDATGDLQAPFHVMGLPDGETIQTMAFYGGVLLIGTTRGVRLALITGTGYLQYGPLVEVTGGVEALEGQGEFCWFAWENYDGSSTGLGRANLSRFVDDLVPAYASDLMYTGQGAVTSVATFDERRFFFVSGVGVVREADSYVTGGTYRSGRVLFGTSEQKRFTSLEVKSEDLNGGNVGYGVYDQEGTQHVVDSDATALLAKGQIPDNVDGEWVEVYLTLTRGGASSTPIVERWTLRALPRPYRVEELYVPLVLHAKVKAGTTGRMVSQEVWEAWRYLWQLSMDREIVTFTMGNETLSVYVDQLYIAGQDDATKIKDWTDDGSWFEATWIAKLVTVEGQ